jgi:hypothetical protein
MGKYSQWITHKGVKVLFVNGKGLREAEYVAALEELKQELLKTRSSVPVLTDMSNTTMTENTTNKAKEVAADTKAAGIPDGPSAVVGLSTLARAVAQMFARGSHYFNTIEEAKEWLVKEEGKRR